MIAHPFFNPIVTLVVGVLIVVFPELLNYIVAAYFIITGIVGIVNLL